MEPDELAHQLFREAWRLEEVGDLEAAISKMRECVRRADVPLYWATLGNFLMKSGCVDEAEQVSRRAATLGPKSFHTWAQLGRSLMVLKRFKEAAKAFQTAARLKQDFNLLTLQAAAEAKFDPEAAARTAAKALELNPEWEEAIAIRERALSQLRQSPEE